MTAITTTTASSEPRSRRMWPWVIAIGAVSVDMTLTVPNCPVADTMPEMVREAVLTIDGVTTCEVNLGWEPRWDPSKMSEVARLALDIY